MPELRPYQGYVPVGDERARSGSVQMSTNDTPGRVIVRMVVTGLGGSTVSELELTASEANEVIGGLKLAIEYAGDTAPVVPTGIGGNHAIQG